MNYPSTAPRWPHLCSIEPSHEALYAAEIRQFMQGAPAIAAAAPAPARGPRSPYSLDDSGSVAVINLVGYVEPEDSPMTRAGAATPMTAVSAAARRAIYDKAVRGVVLLVSSPGGNTDGVQAAYDDISVLSSIKPTVVITKAINCSAAYWVSCGAPRIYASDPTNFIGSVGVRRVVMDISGSLTAQGVNPQSFVSGDLKDTGTPYAPATKAQRDHLQGQVDAMAEILFTDVAFGRGMAVKALKAAAGSGATMLADQAISAGLADGYATLDALVHAMRTAPDQFPLRRKLQARPSAIKTPGAAPAAPQRTAAPASASAALAPAHLPTHVPAHLAGVYARLNRGSR